jgi:hypothetical protein
MGVGTGVSVGTGVGTGVKVGTGVNDGAAVVGTGEGQLSSQAVSQFTS